MAVMGSLVVLPVGLTMERHDQMSAYESRPGSNSSPRLKVQLKHELQGITFAKSKFLLLLPEAKEIITAHLVQSFTMKQKGKSTFSVSFSEQGV